MIVARKGFRHERSEGVYYRNMNAIIHQVLSALLKVFLVFLIKQKL